VVTKKNSIKVMVEKRNGSRLVCVRLCCQISLTDFSCGSWDTQLEKRVVARPCEASWELDFSGCVVCGPFAARGDKGEEEYP
jgi:hypothetical protein